MLEKIDLNRQVDKKTYKQVMPELSNRMYAVQKASWDAHLPVVIIFEGWDAAGKGTSIQKLTACIDPRGFKLYPIRAARTYESKRPWLWRFWLKLPARGEWAIFDRSWYGRVLVERVEDIIPEEEWRRAYRDIVDFERTLADDGALIIKFFLHISKSEQRRRFEKLTKDPLEAWHVSSEDWEHHRRYDAWTLAYEEAFERTDTEWAPWTIVEATDRRYTRIKIFETIIRAVEEKLGINTAATPDLEAAGTSVPEADEELESRAYIELKPDEPGETGPAPAERSEPAEATGETETAPDAPTEIELPQLPEETQESGPAKNSGPDLPAENQPQNSVGTP